MIRSLQKADINRVADIWLDTNLKAHSFISAQYWESNYELVKEMLSQAEVYVYEDGQKIQGFIGLSDKYIEGIFVSEKMQSQGIGKLLLNYIKDRKDVLNVFIHGSIPEKVRRICSLYNVTEVDAIKMINDTDKRRRTNYNFYTEQKWGMAGNYTLSLNSSVLGYDMCQKIIMDCAKI